MDCSYNHVLTYKQFEKFIKTQMVNFEDLYEVAIKSRIINKDTQLYKYKLSDMSCLIYSNKCLKYWNLFKKYNIKLTRPIILEIIENEFRDTTKLIKWCLQNDDYINQYILVNYDSNKDEYYGPKKFHEFIYNFLRDDNFSMMKTFAKKKINIMENHLLERIVIEHMDDYDDGDYIYLLNLFSLNDNFMWNNIDPIIKLIILESLFDKETPKKTYRNIFKNTDIVNYLNGLADPNEYIITKDKIYDYHIKSHIYNIFKENTNIENLTDSIINFYVKYIKSLLNVNTKYEYIHKIKFDL